MARTAFTKSKAGNVEFDIDSRWKSCYRRKTVLGEGGGKYESNQITGADESRSFLPPVKLPNIVVRTRQSCLRHQRSKRTRGKPGGRKFVLGRSSITNWKLSRD